MTTTPAQPHHDSALTTLTNYLIISGLLTCAAIGLVQVGQLMLPNWNAAGVPLLVFGIALESAYMTRYVRHHHLPVSWYVWRGGEVLVLFMMLRSLLGVLRGPQPEQPVNPFTGYVDSELLGLTVILGLVWLASWLMAEDLLTLETIDPTLDREMIKDAAEAQDNARQNLTNLIMIGGGVLAFLAALIRIHLRTNQQIELVDHYSQWHVVIYFVLGLLLLGRLRLSLLRSGWVWENIPITGRVGQRWIAYTFSMLVAAVLVAIVLPTQYSLGLLGTLGYLLTLLIELVQTIIYFITYLVVAFLNWLFPPVAGQPFTGRLPTPTAPLTPPNTPAPSLSEFVQSLIFWAVFFIMAGYVIAQFLRRHPELVATLKHLPGIRFLVRLWQRVRDWFGGLSQQIEDLRAARRAAQRPAPVRSASASRRWINLRRLSPRQQVQFYYLAMLRRTGEKGHPRQPAQTPYEYAQLLETHLPDVDQDIAGLTEEFVAARYAPQDIPPQHVSVVRRYWERIKRALRK